MDQLIINDLDFCQAEISELKGGGWLDIDANLDVATEALLPRGYGYGSAWGTAIALGDLAGGSPQALVIAEAIIAAFP